MPDETPISVTLPAHAWGTVREAVLWYERRLRERVATRPPPPGVIAVDELRAQTLLDAAVRMADRGDG